MTLLINILLAILAFVLSRWIFGLLGLPDPFNLILSVIIAIGVFFGDWGVRFTTRRP